ncbi:MAG: flavodoxin family protein [Actinomycetota bacterium]
MAEPVALKAIFLNCTLKRSPEISNTEALARKVIEWYDTMNVTSEIVRVVDYQIPTGINSYEGEGDEWPLILDKIKAADIVVIATPIWFGVRSSVAQLVIERLDGTYQERNEVGQYPLYNKVAGVVVTGNEDGAHAAAETTLFNLSHLGCTVPPNSDTYWVGDAGPGPSYIEVGQDHAYTERTTRWMAHNTVHLARMLRANPIPAEGNTFDEETEHRPHIG